MKTVSLKNALLAATLATLPLLSPSARAEETTASLKPYVGFDLLRSVYDYGEEDLGGGVVLDGGALLDDTLDGLNIHAGIRPHRNFGVELGYFRTRKADKDISAGSTIGPGLVAATDFSTDTRVQGVTLDALGYLPLGEAGRFELIGTAGLSWSKADASLTIPGIGSESVDDSEIGFRAGAGAQANLTDRINIRGLARYQTASFDDVADHAWTCTLGLNYSF